MHHRIATMWALDSAVVPFPHKSTIGTFQAGWGLQVAVAMVHQLHMLMYSQERGSTEQRRSENMNDENKPNGHMMSSNH